MSTKLKLDARPLSIKQANVYIEEHHRHHKKVTGHRFTIAATLGEEIVGVVVVGRPVARAVDQYAVAEVSRLCVKDGFAEAHVCSFLYARAARAAEAMGFNRIKTYTLESESGASLRAVAWVDEGCPRKNGVGWNNRKGRRSDQPTTTKRRWARTFKETR